jgi:hypothetical protein
MAVSINRRCSEMKPKTAPLETSMAGFHTCEYQRLNIALEAKLAEVEPYAQHKPACKWFNGSLPYECNCGLKEALE